MKKDLSNKKLTLAKETLRNLNDGSLQQVNGGITPVTVFTLGVLVGYSITACTD